MDDHHRIVLLGSNNQKSCLTASYSKANWSRLYFQPCSFAYNPRQEFLFEPLDDPDHFMIRSLHTNKCFYYNERDPWVNMYTCGAWWRVDGQKFQVKFNSPSGLLLLAANFEGPAPTITADGTRSNKAGLAAVANIRENPTESLAQRIVFERSPQRSLLRNHEFDLTKNYTISPRLNAALCLTVPNAQSQVPASQILCATDAATKKRFTFEPFAGYYRIRIANNDLSPSTFCLDYNIESDNPSLVQAACSDKDSQLFAIENILDYSDPVQAFFIVPVMQTQLRILVPDIIAETDLSMDSETFLVLRERSPKSSATMFNYLRQHFLIESPQMDIPQ
ncbi:hypothetical protein DC094_11940 [Pelagibaculum spongiae]|uniref:Uncharacterized protein n=1 Tax=Pelagibaculum spongiae TaxID=2080658 RepID=A0A2V1GUG2_9GAMM|nr:hypothetical protein DC094_11940 [Pelagibaculum spongiae]